MRHLLSKDIAAGVFLMLLPFFVLPMAGDMSMQFDFPKLMGIFLLGNLALCGFFATKVNPIFLVIHGGISISTVVTGFGSPQLYFFVYWTAAVSFSAWFVNLNRIERERILGFIVAGGVLVAAHCYIQILWHDPILSYAPGINPHLPIAFLRQHTLLGAFLAPVCCLAMALRYRKCVLFMLPVFLFTHSNFTLLALIAGLAVVAVDYWGHGILKILLPLGLACLLGIYAIRPATFYSHGRVDVWQETLSWWWKHDKWFGSGGGSFRVLYPPKLTPNYQIIEGTGIQGSRLYDHGAFWQAHNDYIQCAFEFGLIGLFILGSTILVLFVAFIDDFVIFRVRNADQLGCWAMLAALMANALGNFPWQIAPHCLLGVMSLAMVLRKDSVRAII